MDFTQVENLIEKPACLWVQSAILSSTPSWTGQWRYFPFEINPYDLEEETMLSNVQTPMQSNKKHKDSGSMTKSKEQNVSPATNLNKMEIYVFLDK